MSNTLNYMGFEFTYKVLSMDIAQGTMQIEFDPVDQELMPITLNCLLHERPYQTYPEGTYTSQEQVPFDDHMAFTAQTCSPVATWKRHRMMLDNMQAIQAKM